MATNLRSVTHRLTWYSVTIIRPSGGDPAAVDSKGNRGTIECRTRSYCYPQSKTFEEGDAFKEESFMLDDVVLIAAANARGASTWDENDLKTVLGKMLGEEVE